MPIGSLGAMWAWWAKQFHEPKCGSGHVCRIMAWTRQQGLVPYIGSFCIATLRTEVQNIPRGNSRNAETKAVKEWKSTVGVLTTRAKFLEPSGYCIVMHSACTFDTTNVFGLSCNFMVKFELEIESVARSTGQVFK